MRQHLRNVAHQAGPDLLPHRDYPRRAEVQRLVARLHRLGVRSVAEFLDELGKKHRISDQILLQLEQYCRVEPDVLRFAGGDRFAPPPTRGIT